VLYTTVRAAQNFGVKSDYYYRLGKEKSFMLAVQGKVHRYDQNLFDAEVLRQKFTEVQAQAFVGVGYEPNNDFFISGAIGVDGFRFKPVGIDENDLQLYGRIDGVLRGNITVDQLDDPIFPTLGFRSELQGEAHALITNQLTGNPMDGLVIPADGSYASFQLKTKGVASLAPGLVFEASAAAGYKTNASLLDNFRVGGLEDRDTKSLAMLGLNTHQLHFDKYAKGGLTMRIKAGPVLYFGLRADYITGERVFSNISDTNIDPSVDLWGYGGFVGVNTPVGPFRIAVGQNTLTSAWNTNFAFGYSFF